MKIRMIFKINKRLLAAFNSCDQTNQMKVIDDIMQMEESDITKVFQKKYFIWNILRGKDFYKVMARYIINSVQDGNVAVAVNVLRHSLVTAENDDIRRAFVKSIMRAVPLITIETVMYASKERLDALLASAQLDNAIVGQELLPFVNRIRELNESATTLQDLVDMQFIMQ